MRKPSRVRVTGPLEPYVVGFRGELARQGYSRWTAIAHLQLMGHLSRWLGAHGLDASALSPASVELYLRDRRASGQVVRLTPRGLVPLVGYLQELGVVAEPAPPVAEGPGERLLEDFATYLVRERGLAERTVAGYRSVGRLFLPERSSGLGEDGAGLGTLTAGEINAFVLAQSAQRSAGSLNNVVTALRAFLRFLYVQGHTATLLAGAVPAAAGGHPPGTVRAGGGDGDAHR